MVFGQGAHLELGDIRVFTSEPGRGHPPEFWAKCAADRIVAVSNNAPPPIRDQARAFKDQIEIVILSTIRSALHERKAYDALNAGKVSEAAAQAVREGA